MPTAPSPILLNGARLRAARKKVPLTQQELADAVGVDRKSIGNYESGNTQPTAATIQRLADAVKVAPEWVIDPAPPGKLPHHPTDRPTGSIAAFREQMGREADEYYAEHPDEAAADTGLAVIARHASYTVFGADGEVEFRVSYLIEAKPGVEVGAIGAVS